jgi:signal transduction histidine kinase
MFEPFRLGQSAARVGGTGIGLTLVARFARVHGGHAWLEDAPGGGTVAKVLLPVDRTAATAQA